MKIKIKWDLAEAGFEEFLYEEVIRDLGLPKTLVLKLDEDEDVESYLQQEYGFYVDKWEED
jgi:hypothetical protein